MIEKVIFLQKRELKQSLKKEEYTEFNNVRMLKFYIICEEHYVQQCV